MRISISAKIFIALLATLALAAFGSVYLPMGSFGVNANQSPELAKIPKHILGLANAGIVLAVYGILGALGLRLSKKVGLPKLWDETVSNRQRFYSPAIIGTIGGAILIIGDLIFSRFNTIGRITHPPFPTSLVASLSAGIGEELLFRLFFISFWLRLISFFFKKRANLLFWMVAGFSALAFASAHFPAFIIMYGYQSFADIPPVLVGEILLLNSTIAFLAAWQFKKAGYLAAVGVHFWTDLVWHGLYGLTLWLA